ncbi:MAG: VacB/RNase II family 3'-5' exoribonuclease [Planctomycetota bacterium]
MSKSQRGRRRELRPVGPERRFSRNNGPALRRPAEPESSKLIEILGRLDQAATASEIAAKLGADDPRGVSLALKRMVEQGKVLEVRPGRYRASGSSGEHAAIIVNDPENGLMAKTTDGPLIPLHKRYRLGAAVGDVVQVLIAQDGLALVTRILRRGGRNVVGTVLFAPGGMRLISDNRREGQIPILATYPKFHAEYRAGERVVGIIEIDSQGQAGVKIDRILPPDTPEVSDFRHVCLAHDLPGEFPKAVEAAAATFPQTFPLQDREDVRNKLVFTIDPKTAKDFDDAISLEPRSEGGWILGVHIADVCHFVRQGSTLDDEAALRGTSIYLMNRVIPMLPERLSNGLCSLVPREDRYCLTAWLELDRSCKLVGTRLSETVIHSQHRMSYEEALAVLEGHDTTNRWPADLRETLMRVSTIAQRLRADRVAKGALNLYSQEHNFQLDVEGEPIEVVREGSDISHQLIEECMLLANRAVAAWLVAKNYPCVFRIHAEPNQERLKMFATAVENVGIDSKRVQSGRFGLQAVLRDLEKQPPATRLVLNFLCLRAFSKAIYQTENIGHHALAFETYCHFTSPIRRYPDLLVHRLVKHTLGLAGYRNVEIRPDYIDAMAKQSTWLEQRSEDAERDLYSRKAARYLSRRVGETFPGVVTGASGGGLFVQMLETGIDGFLPVRVLTDDRYQFDGERTALVGRHSGRILAPGTELDVRVDAVDIDRSDIVLGIPDAGTESGEQPRTKARPSAKPTKHEHRWVKRRDKRKRS